MKRDGDDFIMHGLFVDDMMHAPTCDRLWKDFLDKTSKVFDITGGDLMETFLSMQVEQSKKAVAYTLTITSRSFSMNTRRTRPSLFDGSTRLSNPD